MNKKLILLGLLLGNIFIVTIAVFLMRGKPATIKPRASERIELLETPTITSPTQMARTREQKLDRLSELGVELATSEPTSEDIEINGYIDKPTLNIDNNSLVKWVISDESEHILEFSDGATSPPLRNGYIYSRRIRGVNNITYTDKNNPNLVGSLVIN